MFKNEYNDTFGATYTSKVWDKAQKANNWSMAFALLYALSKNGMEYASATTGAYSVINDTSIPCRCQMTIEGPTATTGVLRVWYGTRLCIKIPIASSSDGKRAYPSGIFVADSNDKTLGTLCKCAGGTAGEIGTKFCNDNSTVLYASDYDAITNWSNNPDTDEDKYRIQTATFKDKDGSFDIVSVNFWAEDVYLGTISMFKAKDYFSTKYKYGFGMYKALDAGTVYKFSDNTSCAIVPIFDGAGTFSSKIARACFFVSSTFSGVIGGNNGIYQISDGDTSLSLLSGTKVSINGRDFQAVAPGIFARTS